MLLLLLGKLEVKSEDRDWWLLLRFMSFVCMT